MAKTTRKHKVPVHQSLIVARKVVAAINRRGCPYHDSCDLRAYSNGREQGYGIRMRTPHASSPFSTICFAEARGSDSIVVDVNHNFSEEGTSDIGYLNRKEFKPDQFDEAAKYICNAIKKLVRTGQWEYEKQLPVTNQDEE